MLNLIRSDFYKLFRTKAFYICGVLAAIFSCLFGVVIINYTISQFGGISAKSLGYDGVYALTAGIIWANLLVTIMISMFIPNEFSYGTIKNIASKGVSRASIYLSKIVIAVSVSAIYILTCAVVSFTTGSIMWGTGELTREVYLDIFRMLGLFLLVESTMQCIYVMMGFFIRQTGGTVAANLAIFIAMPDLIHLINFGIYSLLKVEDFDISKYWPSTYLSKYTSLDILQEDINVGMIVCAAYIVVSILVGIFFFYKRDVK